jgi:Fe2+ or Zn2+ uptake regulation protein
MTPTSGRDNLKQKLESGKNHLTQQRIAVFDYLQSVEHHPTAEEVFFAVFGLPTMALLLGLWSF